MADDPSTADRILDAAELRMRAEGYNGVSFRELAAETGIKSASVHYHFPTKADLGVAVVSRYHQRFMAGLQDLLQREQDPDARLRGFIALYRRALLEDERICLCGMLGAESGGLPSRVVQEVQAFFRANIDWLAAATEGTDTEGTDTAVAAARIVSTLQGAMILAATMKDPALFEEVADGLTLDRDSG